MKKEIAFLMGAVSAVDGMIHDGYEHFITRNDKGEPVAISYADIRDYLESLMVIRGKDIEKISEETYDDTYDLTIHFTNREEHERFADKLARIGAIRGTIKIEKDWEGKQNEDDS
jgi:hypothetical protein